MDDRFHSWTQRLALGLVALSVSGTVAGFWWNSNRRGEISFLPHWAPAHWIVYPSAADGVTHPQVEVGTVFRSTFTLEKAPAHAKVRLAGFRRYTLSINEVLIDTPVRRGRNWKQPDSFDISAQLRAGQNRISVTVLNSNGPPALWLVLETDAFRLVTDETWEASFAGASWREARLARLPMVTPAGNRLHEDEPLLWTSLRKRWLLLLFFTTLSVVSCWLLNRYGKAAVAEEEKMNWRREILPIAGLAGLWVMLFANNVTALPRWAGFDLDGHVSYIRYIQSNASLPSASEGWEMFQPPLYYVFSAVVLELFGLSVSDLDGIMVLRVLGLLIGLAQLILIWGSLRMVFPGPRSKALWGVVLAASLPPLLYLSHYITNEAFAAAAVSACVWLCLRLLKQEQVSWNWCAALGLCLGAALLAKSSTLLVVPVVLGALAWRWLENHSFSPAQFAGRLGLILAVCAAVSGWHYTRLWLQYGSPLIGVWDPRLGYSWWQDEGYRTGAFYLRFGQVLLHPWFSAMQSFGDGIYSTLWGDGLLGGCASYYARPPWNDDLMAIGYWLALFPMLAVLAGGILTLVKFIRQPSAEWFLLLGLGFLAMWALVHMSMAVPYYCTVKAFYGLGGLVPFCAVGALGLDWLSHRNRWLRRAVCVTFGLWAINSCAAFWISRSSVPVVAARVDGLVLNGQLREGIELLKAHPKTMSESVTLRLLPASLLMMAGDDEGAARYVESILHDNPNDGRGHHMLAVVLARQHRVEQARQHAKRAVELIPGFGPAWEHLAMLLMEQRNEEEMIQVCRSGLAVTPFSPKLQFILGFALLTAGQDADADAHLRLAFLLDPKWSDGHTRLARLLTSRKRLERAIAEYQAALRLKPDSLEPLNDLAWIRAASPETGFRNGTEAVSLAERACQLTGYQRPLLLVTLAAAYAEAGRFEEAAVVSGKARDLAAANGQPRLAERSQKLIELFNTRQPVRETEEATSENQPGNLLPSD